MPLTYPLAFGAADVAFSLLDAITSRRGYSRRAKVRYGSHPRQYLDAYAPTGSSDDAPVVVFFHGGSWDRGEARWYRFVGQALASAGLVAVIAEYRLYPEVTFPAFVEDGARAVAWAARAFPRAALFVAGHSAGAHIAALINLDPRYLADAGVPRNILAGAIGISGPYDFLPLTEERYRLVFPEISRADSQPIAHVDGKAAPMLLITGAADRTVDPGNTTRLAAAINAKGGDVSVRAYPGVGHLGPLLALARALPYYGKPPVRADVAAFVHRLAKKRDVQA